MAFDRQILEKLSELDEVVEDVQDIAETDYSDRMHVEPEYDASDDALRAFVDDLRYDEETAEQVYEDLKNTDYSSEEVKEVFIEHTDVDPRELSPMDRRQFLKWAGAATAGTYAVDSGINHLLLDDMNADNFEAPAGSYHERAVREMLDGNEITIQLYNIRFDNQESEHDEQELVEYVEDCISELEGTNFQIEFQNLNATEQGLLDEGEEVEDFDEEIQKRLSNTVEQYREIIKENNVTDSIDEENSLWSNDYTNLASQIDGMVGMLTEELQPHEFEDIKVAVADFANGDAAGVSTYDHRGTNEWALVDRKGQKSTEETIVHEIGHKLGLPHTKYPDLKRGGFFPDTMSYSPGTISIPNAVHSMVDNSAFGRQSHYNWERVKEHVER